MNHPDPSEDRPEVHLVIAGSLDQKTGGYLYDRRMVEGLRARGWTVRVHEVGGRWPTPAPAAHRELDARLSGLPEGGVVVIDGLVGGAAPAELERASARLRIVLLVHHPLADEFGLEPEVEVELRASEAAALATASSVVVTSRFTASRILEMRPGTSVPAVVEPGTEPVGEVSGAGVPGGGVPGRGPVLLCLGTVVPRKDQLTLVEALAGLADLDFRCEIAGSLERAPDYVEGLRKTLEGSPVGERVRLLGEVDDPTLGALWDAADLFVLPSRYEGYGMAFTEAMVRGLPIVGTTGGAIPFTVPESVGRLVPPGNVDALRRALRELLSDQKLLTRMAERSRAHAAGLPDWGHQVERFESVLREVHDG